jgi:hypothetical protein
MMGRGPKGKMICVFSIFVGGLRVEGKKEGKRGRGVGIGIGTGIGIGESAN